MDELRKEARGAAKRYSEGLPVPRAVYALEAVSCVIQAGDPTDQDLDLLDVVRYALDSVYSDRSLAPRDSRLEDLEAASGAPAWGGAGRRGEEASTKEDRQETMARAFETLALLQDWQFTPCLRLASLATFCRALKASPSWIREELWEACSPHIHMFITAALCPGVLRCELVQGAGPPGLEPDTVLAIISETFGRKRYFDVISDALYRLSSEILSRDGDKHFQEFWAKQGDFWAADSAQEDSMLKTFYTQEVDLQASSHVEQPSVSADAASSNWFAARGQAFPKLFFLWWNTSCGRDTSMAAFDDQFSGAAPGDTEGTDLAGGQTLWLDPFSISTWVILITALRVSSMRGDSALARAASHLVMVCLRQQDKRSHRLVKLSSRPAAELTVFQAAGESDGEMLFLALDKGSKTRLSYSSIESLCRLSRYQLCAFFVSLISLSHLGDADDLASGATDLSRCSISLSDSLVVILDAFHRLSAIQTADQRNLVPDATHLAIGQTSAVTSATVTRPNEEADLQTFVLLAKSCYSLLREGICDGTEFACGASGMGVHMLDELVRCTTEGDNPESLFLWLPVCVFERALQLYRETPEAVCSQEICTLKFVFLHLMGSSPLRLVALQLLASLLQGQWTLDTGIPRLLLFLQIYGDAVAWPLLEAVLSGDAERWCGTALSTLVERLFTIECRSCEVSSAGTPRTPSHDWLQDYLEREDRMSEGRCPGSLGRNAVDAYITKAFVPPRNPQRASLRRYPGAVMFALLIVRYITVNKCAFVEQLPLHGIPTALRRAVKRFYRGKLSSFSLAVYLRLGFCLYHRSPQELWGREFSFYSLIPPGHSSGGPSDSSSGFDLQNLCTSSLLPLLADLQDRESDSCVTAAAIFKLDFGEGAGSALASEHAGGPDAMPTGMQGPSAPDSFAASLQDVRDYAFPMFSVIELGGEKSVQSLASRAKDKLEAGYLCDSLREQVFTFLGGCSFQLFTQSYSRLLPELFSPIGAGQQTGTMTSTDAFRGAEGAFLERPGSPLTWADLVLFTGQTISALSSPYAHVRFSAVCLLHAIGRSQFLTENILKRYFYTPFDNVLELSPEEADGMSVLRSQILQAAVCAASAVPLLSVLWKLSEQTVRVPSTVLNQALGGLESPERIEEQKSWATLLGRNAGVLLLSSKERRFLDSVASDLSAVLEKKSATPEAPAAMSQTLFEAIFSPLVSLCVAGTAVDAPLPEGLGRTLLSVLRKDPEMLAMAVQKFGTVIDDIKCAGVSATALQLQESTLAQHSLYLTGYEQKVAEGRTGMASLFLSESVFQDASELIGASMLTETQNLELPLSQAATVGRFTLPQDKYWDGSFLLFALHYLLDRIRAFTAATAIDQVVFTSLSELFNALTSLVSIVQVPPGSVDLIVTSTRFHDVQLFEREAYCSLVLSRLELLRKISQKYSLSGALESPEGTEESGSEAGTGSNGGPGDLDPQDLAPRDNTLDQALLLAKQTIDSELSRVWFGAVDQIQGLYAERRVSAATLREFVRFIAGFDTSGGDFCIKVISSLSGSVQTMGQADGLAIYLSFIDSTLDLASAPDLASWLLDEAEDRRCEFVLVAVLFVAVLHDAERYQNSELFLHELFGSTSCSLLFSVFQLIFDARVDGLGVSEQQNEEAGTNSGLRTNGVPDVDDAPTLHDATATYRIIGTSPFTGKAARATAKSETISDEVYSEILRFLRASILGRVSPYAKAFSGFISRGNISGAIGSTRTQLLDRALIEGNVLAFVLLVEGSTTHFDASQKAQLMEIVKGLSFTPERAGACLRLLEAIEGTTPDIHALLAITCHESIASVICNSCLGDGGREGVEFTDVLQAECYPVALRRSNLRAAVWSGASARVGSATESASPSSTSDTQAETSALLHNCDVEGVIYPYPSTRRAQTLPYVRVFVDSLLEQGRLDIVQSLVDTLSTCCSGKSVESICLICDVLIDIALAVLGSGAGRPIDYNVREILAASRDAVLRSLTVESRSAFPLTAASAAFVAPTGTGSWQTHVGGVTSSAEAPNPELWNSSTSDGGMGGSRPGEPQMGSLALSGGLPGAGLPPRHPALSATRGEGASLISEADVSLSLGDNRMVSQKTQLVIYLSHTCPQLLRRILWLDSLGRAPLSATLGSLQVSYSRQTLRDFRASTELYHSLKAYISGAILPLFYRSAVASMLANDGEIGESVYLPAGVELNDTAHTESEKGAQSAPPALHPVAGATRERHSRTAATLDVILSQLLRLTNPLVCHQYTSFLGDQFYHTDSREPELRSARLLCQPALAALLMLRCFAAVPIREEILAGLASLLGILSLEEQLELDVLANLLQSVPELFAGGPRATGKTGRGLPSSLDLRALSGRMAIDIASGELVELSSFLSSPSQEVGPVDLPMIQKIYHNTIGVVYRLP